MRRWLLPKPSAIASARPHPAKAGDRRLVRTAAVLLVELLPRTANSRVRPAGSDPKLHVIHPPLIAPRFT
jgi:hypothetical protein